MRRSVLVLAKLFLAYLAAGAILVMYVRWPHFEGHADVPFSGFPAFLLWSPVAPALVLADWSENWKDGALSFLVYGGAFVCIAWLLLRARSRPATDDVVDDQRTAERIRASRR